MPRKKHEKSGKIKQPSLKRKTFEARGRIWIDGSEGTFLGHGRVVLMERIIEHGSITKAAKSMNMSYRHAWRLMDSMNRQSPRPFVLTATGGKKGGGTVVTEHGKRAIKLFWKLNSDFRKFLDKKTIALNFIEGV